MALKKKPEFMKWLERGRITEYQAKDAAKHFRRHRPTISAYRRKGVLYLDFYCKQCETGWEFPITEDEPAPKAAGQTSTKTRPAH